jgi:hypothetical protein
MQTKINVNPLQTTSIDFDPSMHLYIDIRVKVGISSQKLTRQRVQCMVSTDSITNYRGKDNMAFQNDRYNVMTNPILKIKLVMLSRPKPINLISSRSWHSPNIQLFDATDN